jgi:Fn3 associated
MKNAIRLFAPLVILWLGALAGFADEIALLDIQFGIDASTVKSGPAAIGLANNDQWNLYSRDDGHGGYKSSGSLVNLRLSDGSVSGAGLVITNAPGAFGSGYPDPMFGVYLYNLNGGDITVTLTNLLAGTYEVYAYGHGEQNAFNSAFDVTSGSDDYGVLKTATNADWTSPIWVEGGQYVKFTNVVALTGQPLVLTARHDGTTTPIINGLQLLKVSDATLSFIPGGGLFTNRALVSLHGGAPARELHYTLDGSDPTVGSPVYAAPIQLAAAATIKARAFVGGQPDSDIVTASFARVYALDDGIPAAWRLQYFGPGYLTDPRAAANADPDNDGATNLQEFVAGTNPLDPLSGFAVGIRLVPSITWFSVPGKTYNVLRKQRLSDVQWNVVQTVTATNSTSHFTDESAGQIMYIYTIQPAP